MIIIYKYSHNTMNLSEDLSIDKELFSGFRSLQRKIQNIYIQVNHLSEYINLY